MNIKRNVESLRDKLNGFEVSKRINDSFLGSRFEESAFAKCAEKAYEDYLNIVENKDLFYKTFYLSISPAKILVHTIGLYAAHIFYKDKPWEVEGEYNFIHYNSDNKEKKESKV